MNGLFISLVRKFGLYPTGNGKSLKISEQSDDLRFVLFFFLAAPQGLRDLIFSTKD